MGRTCFQLVKHKQVLASVLTSWIKAMQNCPNDPVGGDEVPACEGYSSPSAKVSVSLAGLISTPGTKDQYVVQALGMGWDNDDHK